MHHQARFLFQMIMKSVVEDFNKGTRITIVPGILRIF